MTVYFSDNYKDASFFSIWTLLFRWRGSIYKRIAKDFIFYALVYIFICLSYRTVLNSEQKGFFEELVLYVRKSFVIPPVTFVVGIVVSIAYDRFQAIWVKFPWPEGITSMLMAIHGEDDRGRMLRRTTVRYINLSIVMCLRTCSPPLQWRFPDYESLEASGIMEEHERVFFQKIEVECPTSSKYWIPLGWASLVVRKAYEEGRIEDSLTANHIIQEILAFRGNLVTIIDYNCIPLPLALAQSAAIMVYVYLGLNLLASQVLIHPLHNAVSEQESQGYPDIMYPILLPFEFIFYCGWVRIAEGLMNPFGMDDEDFDCSWIITRNLNLSMWTIEEGWKEMPASFSNSANFASDFIPYTAKTKAWMKYQKRKRELNLFKGSTDAAFLASSKPDWFVVPETASDTLRGEYHEIKSAYSKLEKEIEHVEILPKLRRRKAKNQANKNDKAQYFKEVQVPKRYLNPTIINDYQFRNLEDMNRSHEAKSTVDFAEVPARRNLRKTPSTPGKDASFYLNKYLPHDEESIEPNDDDQNRR